MMKLNHNNYFSKRANRDYMSVSQYKAFKKCPASAMAEIKGKYKRAETTPLLVGSYVDSYFEGTLEKFKQEHLDLFKKDGTLKFDFIKAEEIIKRIEKDRLFMKYLSGEKQVIMTGKINGIPVKIKIDSLLKDKIVDLKVMKDFENRYDSERGCNVSWIEAWGYDIQGAIYQEIVYQNTGKKLPFYIAGATKEPVTDIGIWKLSQDTLEFELEKFKENAPLYDAIKNKIIKNPERCGKCDYCKITKKLSEKDIITEEEFI